MSGDAFKSNLLELRTSFDDAFTRRATPADAAHEDLLDLRAGDVDYVISVKGLAGLRQATAPLRVPTQVPAFRGIVRERSQLLPVFDLAALLGGTPADSARWLLLPRAAPIALAFDAFAGHRRIKTSAIVPRTSGASATFEFAAGAVTVGGRSIPLLNLEAILARAGAFRRSAALETP